MATVYPITPPCFREPGFLNVTSVFGLRTDPVTGKIQVSHAGVDCTRMTDEGSATATITAVADGVVEEIYDEETGNVQYKNARGNYVFIRHNAREVTVYQHLQKGVYVKPGQLILRGDALGYMGNTGKVTGAHLHFEVQRDGAAIDALPYLLYEKSIESDIGGDTAMLYHIFLDQDLKRGDKGEAVVQLQTVLCRLSAEIEQEVRGHSFKNDKPDGSYGGGMVGTVRRVQQMAGIPETGICDAMTRNVLNLSAAELFRRIDETFGRR